MNIWRLPLTLRLLTNAVGWPSVLKRSSSLQLTLPAAFSQLQTDIHELKDATVLLRSYTSYTRVCIQQTVLMVLRTLTSLVKHYDFSKRLGRPPGNTHFDNFSRLA